MATQPARRRRAPRELFPPLEPYRQGRLKLDELVSATYDLADFQQALDELHEGRLARGVLTVQS